MEKSLVRELKHTFLAQRVLKRLKIKHSYNIPGVKSSCAFSSDHSSQTSCHRRSSGMAWDAGAQCRYVAWAGSGLSIDHISHREHGWKGCHSLLQLLRMKELRGWRQEQRGIRKPWTTYNYPSYYEYLDLVNDLVNKYTWTYIFNILFQFSQIQCEVFIK